MLTDEKMMAVGHCKSRVPLWDHEVSLCDGRALRGMDCTEKGRELTWCDFKVPTRYIVEQARYDAQDTPYKAIQGDKAPRAGSQ